MDALQESGWEELRKEARKIEGDLDVKLSSYAKLGARFTQGGTSFLCYPPSICWDISLYVFLLNMDFLLSELRNFQ